jgi:hypothetical protein
MMGMVGSVVAVVVIVVDGRCALIWMISQNLLYNDSSQHTSHHVSA